tara:strand:- start:3063 stop:3608 length:546 start_codon:yes stop_codon:yes gene_type:complete
MATTLRPFRDYDEHDVINLFSLSGDVTNGVTKGHMVKLQAGWSNTAELDRLGAVGSSYANTVSERYGVAAKVAVAGSGDSVLGMMLYDVKETDENGEKFIFNPRKAAENDVVLSGQAVPVMTRGIVLYSGTQLAADNPTLGATLYSDNNGELTTTDGGGSAVGIALGAEDDNNHVLVRINL